MWKTLKPREAERLWAGSSTLFELSQKISFLGGSTTPCTPDAGEAAVGSIPDTFARFFDHIASSLGFLAPDSLGCRVLPWITHSLRVLTISELAVCVSVEGVSVPEKLTSEYLRKNSSWSLRADLERALGPVISITGEKVQISHPLYRERILAQPMFRGNTNLQLLIRCIDYLKAIGASWSVGGEFERENRLVEYAALYWPDHYRAVMTDNERPLSPDKEDAYCSVVSLLYEYEYFKAWL